MGAIVEIPGWVPSTLIALAGAVAVIASLRSEFRHLKEGFGEWKKDFTKRLEALEKSVQTSTPRLATLDRHEAELGHLNDEIHRMGGRRARGRTPVRGVSVLEPPPLPLPPSDYEGGDT